MNYIGLTQKRQVAAADGARCPAYGTPPRRFCLNPESLGRGVDEVMATRVGGASCPVTPEPIDVQLRKSYNTRYRSKLRYFSVTIEFDSMTV